MVDPASSSIDDPAEVFYTVVIPVYNEADNIVPLLDLMSSQLAAPHETVLVYDDESDTTLPPARAFAARYDSLRLVPNQHGSGVLTAIRTGFDVAGGDVVVVTMADLSDDVSQIEELVSLVRSGAAVAAASRYVRGGRQMGGPLVKRTLSRLAGLSLHSFGGLAIHDPTSNFKAYDKNFLDTVEIESRRGFELALELVAKAHQRGLPMAEIPTVWRDRTAGSSRFRLWKWLPGYLHWYGVCLRAGWVRTLRPARRRGNDG